VTQDTVLPVCKPLISMTLHAWEGEYGALSGDRDRPAKVAGAGVWLALIDLDHVTLMNDSTLFGKLRMKDSANLWHVYQL